jgi:hypothetical protein
MRKAYDDALIDRRSIHPDDVLEEMALGKQSVIGRLERRHPLIGDVEKDMGWMSAWLHVIEEQRPSRSFEPPETYRRQVLKSAATTPVVAAAVRSSNSVVASDRGRVRRRTPLWRSAENPRALSVGLSAGASTRSSAGCRHRTKSCAHCRASGRAWCRRAARVFPAGTASPAVRARAG